MTEEQQIYEHIKEQIHGLEKQLQGIRESVSDIIHYANNICEIFDFDIKVKHLRDVGVVLKRVDELEYDDFTDEKGFLFPSELFENTIPPFYIKNITKEKDVNVDTSSDSDTDDNSKEEEHIDSSALVPCVGRCNREQWRAYEKMRNNIESSK